jgi:lipopolysaccharide transport system ATP-binding protein
MAIQVENLSKRYWISRQTQHKSDTLRDELAETIRRLLHRGNARKFDEFWAIRDVSFEIRQGERVGIVGRNGAGKSTLLKMMSRITEPTKGRISISGRVASLLEVGTGFHPELTGRENIFLNGAILGMKRKEIVRKFDEIVAFAEVEKFLDTPVKYYSSGMYVRLAFAVAAHLEPEILIVDEVLAVGDLAFQKKCLAKMNNIGDEGTTVLFVSHNIAAIQSLCDTAIYLDRGQMAMHGKVEPVTRRYLDESQQLTQVPLNLRTDRSGSGALRFVSMEFCDEQEHAVSAYRSGQHARLLFHFIPASGADLKNVTVAVIIDDEQGARIACLSNEMSTESFSTIPQSTRAFALNIDRLPLLPGAYRLHLYCSVNGGMADAIQDAGVLMIEPGDFFGTGRSLAASNHGCVLMQHRFDLCSAE